MYPNCVPNIMILVQAVLQIFCSQGCFTTQNAKSRKREIIQSNSFGILPNVNQVIYTLDTICHCPSSSGSRDIMLTRFHRLTMGKSRKQTSKKGHNARKQFRRKKIRVRLFFKISPRTKFQDRIFNRP